MTHPQHPPGRRQRPNHQGRPVRTQVRKQVRPVATLPVVKKVHYQHAMAAPSRDPRRLSPGIIGLLAAVGAGAVALTVAAIGSCNSPAQALPCPVPANTAVTPAPAAPPITCTTSRGAHYVWVHGGGGWVRSRDGVHPDPGVHGIGEADGSGGKSGGKGTGGVGDGHGGAGHGGGDGG